VPCGLVAIGIAQVFPRQSVGPYGYLFWTTARTGSVS
jgi:hypothetical protein